MMVDISSEYEGISAGISFVKFRGVWKQYIMFVLRFSGLA